MASSCDTFFESMNDMSDCIYDITYTITNVVHIIHNNPDSNEKARLAKSASEIIGELNGILVRMNDILQETLKQ
jgi:hypothetical protein